MSSHVRTADHPVDPLFLDRWSPRAFDGMPMAEDDLLTILEAARWAPSCYNLQPWRFVYALRDTADWPRFLDLLIPSNRVWAEHASALLVVLSDREIWLDGATEPQPSYSHAFDAGAAWGYLALQARRLGYDAHAMLGIQVADVGPAVGASERFRVEAMVAVGRRSSPLRLPEKLQARETPSGRRPLAALAHRGRLGP